MKTKKISALLFMVSFTVITMAQTATPKVRARQENQQARIINGAKSGEMTKKEVIKNEMMQKKIQNDKKAAKADGVVTPEEKAKLNREQNRASRMIARDKHDAQKRR